MPAAQHLALMRGLNVGGKKKLPMDVLAKMFVDAGCRDVRTYIQSGNVIFNAAPKVLARVSDRVVAAITDQFGYRTPVVLFTVDQLRAAIANNPFFAQGAAENAIYLMFLASAPKPEDIARLDPNRSPGDAFVVRGQVVYLHLPSNVAGTKLTNAYFDSKLATISTSRNWRTVNKLLELMA